MIPVLLLDGEEWLGTLRLWEGNWKGLKLEL